jgi:hypothetical protein
VSRHLVGVRRTIEWSSTARRRSVCTLRKAETMRTTILLLLAVVSLFACSSAEEPTAVAADCVREASYDAACVAKTQIKTSAALVCPTLARQDQGVLDSSGDCQKVAVGKAGELTLCCE